MGRGECGEIFTVGGREMNLKMSRERSEKRAFLSELCILIYHCAFGHTTWKRNFHMHGKIHKRSMGWRKQ